MLTGDAVNTAVRVKQHASSSRGKHARCRSGKSRE
jgi:hypothetical protein